MIELVGNGLRAVPYKHIDKQKNPYRRISL